SGSRHLHPVPPSPPPANHILDADLPQGFRDLNISYAGSTDPSRHMRSFENMAVLHRYNDPVQCRAFLTTLRGSAQDWFHQLPTGAIKDFEGFSASFLNQFASVRLQEKSYLTLMGIQQKEGESLRDYVARYTRACIEVPRASEEIKAGGLTRGLLPGLCRNSLAKHPGRTFDEVLGRCAKYMNVDEAEIDFSRTAKESKADPRDEKREKRISSAGERKGPTQYTPLSAPQARILEVMEREIHDNVVRWPKTRKDGPTRPKSNLYCRFHKDYGHNTDDCRHLKDEIERLIKAGHLKEFIYKDREKSNRRRERSRSPRKRARTPEREELPQKRGTIHMIFGGSTDGDSNRARKAYARGRHGKVEVQQVDENGPVINFGPADAGEVERPQNDALMITAQISGYEVQRVFVDTGSSVNNAAALGIKLRNQLITLLKEFRDVFAFTPEELTGIDPAIMEHKLNVDPLRKPVKQRLRCHGEEIDKAIEVEVDKLLRAGHVKEIQFPEWISNTVMVRKALNKWRMCIDFRDLNLACPKDHYPLPRIDQLVDSMTGCELLSMMDASQGYHQIPLCPEDQSKVSFVTSKGTYCYVVMPFGLKNAGATYQRLMDRMFKSQIGRNIEVYVDDILVKSKASTSHPDDLRETFQTLRAFGMKLNPNKCAFGVKAGRFLGYIVTERGIEVNRQKVKAILDMAPPRSIRDVQVLTGRIAGLSRFIARAAEKSFPFFKLLKKKSTFSWSHEAQMAFEKLKEFLGELPLLTKPEPGDELVLYISVGSVSLSSVLLREEGGVQRPIYYTSRVLQGAETRYSEIEKAALTLVITARKLRPYFLNHVVVVRTNFQLGETLGRPTVSGRLVKWAVELSEYSIKYEPRRVIKAQALADFIQEGTKGDEKKWVIHVDGSSAAKGSGLGI
ncbi:Unknown protein, partial [Striga hermonthica]